MQRLPPVSGRDLIRYFTNEKGYVIRRSKGSHFILRSPDNNTIIVVPLHNELDRGTLLSILERAGISRSDFIREWRG